MNYCVECQQDFGSLSAFDRHRQGRHEYTYSEGVRKYGREDGRRCLAVWEMEELRDARERPVFVRNGSGRWSIGSDLEAAARVKYEARRG